MRLCVHRIIHIGLLKATQGLIGLGYIWLHRVTYIATQENIGPHKVT